MLFTFTPSVISCPELLPSSGRRLWRPLWQVVLGAHQGQRHQMELWKVLRGTRREAGDEVAPIHRNIWSQGRHLQIPARQQNSGLDFRRRFGRQEQRQHCLMGEDGMVNEKEAWKQKTCGAFSDPGVEGSSLVHSGCPANPQPHSIFSPQQLLNVASINH